MQKGVGTSRGCDETRKNLPLVCTVTIHVSQLNLKVKLLAQCSHQAAALRDSRKKN